MKRGKDEEKIVEPMFPRLHVKDADKGGGPRAPPRNKMALYEQLTIPSQRFTGLESLPRNTNTFFSPPVTTLAHRCDQRKTVREEDDFAVPVYNNSSRRFQCPGKSEKRTTLFRDQAKGSSRRPGGFLSAAEDMILEKSASGCERVNASLRQESTSSRLDQDGDETDNGVESHHANPDDVGHVGECSGSGGAHVSMQHINEEACDDDSDVSPDEVVGILGQKRFWRARKAITNQQRIFAVQLFELHRLIKVQRLIASSSDVLLDEISYLGKVDAKSFPVKKLIPSGFIVKPPLPHATKHGSSDSEKTDQHEIECSAENVVEKLSTQGQHQPSNYMPFASNPPSVNECYYPPQPPPPSRGNQQWLIPVMSPSEGLIYKPHPGPVSGGYYGHFMPAPMIMGSFMVGGPPPFHPGVGYLSPGNGYFPPYGIMNPYGSGQQQQPSEQMNQFVHPGNLQYASAVNTQQQSSVNEDISQQQPTKSYPRPRKSRQKSRGSSPSGSEGISGTNSFRPLSVVDDNNEPNEQILTTTTTTTRTTVTQTTRDGGGLTRVIKVVPHNAKLASENVARIFRSIQEERKHYDSLF